MNKISSYLDGVKTVGIAGHVNPDGDCVGSTLGMYLYLKENYPEISADLYLESVQPEFMFLTDIQEYKNTCEEQKEYDLFIILDVSAPDRIGVAESAFQKAKKTLCIDHHISNKGFAAENRIVPDASSASEVLYGMLEEEKISKAAAEAIYLGIVHDSGVFQYSNTKPETLRIAAKLMEKGVPFTKIIEETFYQKTYLQQQILGRTLMESIRLMDGKCIVGIVNRKQMEFYGITKADLEGIVSQLRLTKGVEVAIFIYETDFQVYKVSLRSNSYVDVSKIAQAFGGGGHVHAAGCTMHGRAYDVVNNLTYYIDNMLKENND